ncbi:MAG: alkyl hydroperoxide reductase [Robiginitomaculum sp.]|nr:MAG: alkyl hydroperoxide reductase [Robiginitomaculum sp.]
MDVMRENVQAPPLEVSDWLNTKDDLSLSALKGKVVVIHAFQIFCPACVCHATPQAKKIHEQFKGQPLQLIGLHTVFEHHDVMNKAALETFIHEYGISFPVAIDKPSKKNSLPMTMKKYQLRGTPSLLAIDQYGKLVINHFGQISDMQIGQILGHLLADID